MAKINWTLQTFNLDELTDYYKNPRSLTEKEFKQLKTSLDKFGMIDKPIVNLDSANTIIGGHQRKHVLESTGVKEIECWIPDRELTEREVEELNIRLNKNTGSWDFDVLANEFELDDLLEWGFDKKELDIDLWAGEAPEDVEPQIDKAEELREKWGVETGQLWQLGEHRLVCGDCTDRAVVERVMGGEVAGAVVTDPPYGINLDTDLSAIKTNWKGWEGQGGNYSPVIGDDKPFNPAHLFEYFNCAEMFLWGADYFAEKLPNRNEGSWLVWDKRVNEKTGADLSWGIGSEFELCWSKTKHKRDVIRKLWSGLYGTETQDVRKRIHPTQKPLEVIEWILEKYIKQSENIVDPYLGSGTTLIACERLGRKCRAVEISPAYVAVAIQRWVDVTGGEPVLLTL
jgi:site-specific DNA-methyltransferase (adenine-specific)